MEELTSVNSMAYFQISAWGLLGGKKKVLMQPSLRLEQSVFPYR